MHLHSPTLKLGSATQGVSYLVRLPLHMDEFEPIGLHLFHPSRLTVREVRGRVLQQRLERRVIGSEDEVPIAKPEPPSLRHCGHYCQPFPIRGVVTGLGW